MFVMRDSKKLTLSIVIPVYNEEDYLKACLDSIVSQTELPDEVIVVDNNSKDKSSAVARSFKFVRILPEACQGIVYARDTGFNACRSDLIGRIDADSTLPPDWVAKMKQNYRAAGSPEMFAATAPADFRNSGPKFMWFGLHRLTYFWFGRLLLGCWPLYGSNMVMSRQLWSELRGNLCRQRFFHEDMDLAWHIHKNAVPINFFTKPKVTVSARRMGVKAFYYPLMMLRTRFNKNHFVRDFKTR